MGPVESVAPLMDWEWSPGIRTTLECGWVGMVVLVVDDRRVGPAAAAGSHVSCRQSCTKEDGDLKLWTRLLWALQLGRT